MNTPTILTVAPGTAPVRPDWSPIATPAAHDFLAHTPDPTKYHSTHGRTMIPRADKFGGSLAFRPTDPVVVNIDPTDPGTGAGGLRVDLAKLDKEQTAAVTAAASDAYSAWTKLAAAHESGYTTPVTQPDGSVRSAPSPVAPLPLTSSVPPASEPGIRLARPDEYTVAFTQPAPFASLPALGPDLGVIMGRLERLAAEVAQLRVQPQSVEPAAAIERASVLRQFVGTPVRPSVPVVFDLGPGGVHRVHFHHVSIRGTSIFLFYDGRYTEGYRFLPPITPEGQSIGVTLPNQGEITYSVAVLPLNNTLDYVDIVQLLIMTNSNGAATDMVFGDLGPVDETGA
jgi:hypothetical protein